MATAAAELDPQPGAPGTTGHAALLPSVLVPDGDGAPRAKRTRRDWAVDAACFLLALLGGLGMLIEEVERTGADGLRPFLDLLAGFLACCALWVRRRWPVGVAVALLALAVVATSASAAALIAFFTVAVHRRFAVVLAMGAVSIASIPVYYELHPDDTNPLWLGYTMSTIITFAVAAWGMFVRARRQLVASLRERAERAEAERHAHAQHAREQERARIAREMHDVLAHRISLLSMHAGALEFRPDAPPQEIARAAGVVRASAHQALQDLREVIGVLRDAPDDEVAPERPQPTLADVPALVEESRAAGMQARLRMQVGDPAGAPAVTGRNAYRIVQEGLTNARKHAQGTSVVVTLRGRPGEGLTVEIRNPLPVGRPAAEIPGAGRGVIGLAERAHLAGGRLEHGRTPGGDHRLWAWLPWPA